MRRLAIALFVSVLAWVGVAAQRFEVTSVKPEEQLGLKLEPQQAALEVVVIDRVEQLTPD